MSRRPLFETSSSSEAGPEDAEDDADEEGEEDAAAGEVETVANDRSATLLLLLRVLRAKRRTNNMKNENPLVNENFAHSGLF